MINIPIYRAKKIDSDEYVIGMLTKRVFTSYLLIRDDITTKLSKIDSTTLAISFPDMLDSQGNKIFASLSEDGKGGDIIRSEFNHNCIVKYREYFFYADNKEKHINCFGFINSTVIGIQK